MGFIASTIIVLQTQCGLSKIDFSQQLPASEIPKSITWVGKFTLLSDMMNLKNQLVVNKELKFFESLEESENDFGVKSINILEMNRLLVGNRVSYHAMVCAALILEFFVIFLFKGNLNCVKYSNENYY